jgi:hypothetical protein
LTHAGQNRLGQRPTHRSLITVAPPHAGISCLMGVECRACVDGTYSPVQDFARPIMFASHRGCHGRDGRAILVESWGNESPTLEPSCKCPPGMHAESSIAQAAPASPVPFSLIQNVIFAWQESYIGNSNSSSVGYAPDDTPASVPGSGGGYKCG